ncbi:MAG: hypothetical protein GY722_28715 [bacterium]|nr:hypothetical protein [bacterium]
MTSTRRQSRLLTILDGSGHLAEEVGDKAALLDALIGHGFPTPDAMVLTTAAYREVTEHHSIELLVDDLRTSAIPDSDHIAAESAAIQRLFQSASLSPPLVRALDRIATDSLAHGPVAVRCSVVNEDAGTSSIAGNYLTVPNVSDRAGLERAVRSVWASLWMPGARTRRRSSHMHDHHISVAVIVQRMIHTEWAGRAYTSDPDGREHLLRIDVADPEPGSYLLRKDTLEPALDTISPPLLLEDLARVVVRLATSLDYPLEVAWILGRSGASLIEAWPANDTRDVSGLNDSFDSLPDTDDTYTPHGVIEMLPGVVPPLLWTINAPMLENAFRSAFADLGANTLESSHHIVARIHGRVALNLSTICRVAESLPGGDPSEVERQYLGQQVSPRTDSSADSPARGSGVHLFAALRSRQVHKRIIDDVELIDTAARTIAGLSVGLHDLPVRKLVAYRQRIRDLAWRGYTAEVGASSAAGATYRALELLLGRWLPETEAEQWAQRLARTAIDASTLGGLRAQDLVSVLKTYTTDEIREIIATETDDPRCYIAALGPVGERFLRHLDGAIAAMGSKALYGDRTWAEDDAWVWLQLRLLLSAETSTRLLATPAGTEYAELVRLLNHDKKWRRLRILTGQFIDLRARWLRRQVDETTAFLELRERAKNALLILGGEERRVIVEAAGRLMASSQLPSIDFVDYLTDSELDEMLFGSRTVEIAELERRRAVGMSCREGGPLPDWFVGDPEGHAVSTGHQPGPLNGRGTSPGQATGTVRVVASLADGVRLEPGDVLVAHSTDPSWTPLFLSAGAVILETGGPLSHASIVAREFGLPAVVNVPAATRTLIDGETVLVDGTAGIVERLSGGEQ